MLIEYLTVHYAVPHRPRAAAVFRLYREESLKQGIAPVGERVFYRERAAFEDHQVDIAQIKNELITSPEKS